MEVESKWGVLLGFGTLLLFVGVLGSVIWKLSYPPVSDKQYLIIFHDPIPGLEKNSKVTLQGIAVGRVSRIELQQPTRKHSFQARVWITILPHWAERVVLYQDAAPRIREIGNEESAQGKLQVGDIVRAIGIGDESVSCKYVYEVERILHRINREIQNDPSLTFQLTVERAGRQLAPVRFNGALGDLELEFSNLGTRATLQTNLVTNIQHIELSGGSSGMQSLPSLADLARAKGQDIASFIAQTPTQELDVLSAVIPTQPTALGKLFDRFVRKVPAQLKRFDRFMLQADTAVRSINEVLDNAKRMTAQDGSLSQLIDNADKTVREGGKLIKGVNDDGKLTRVLDNTDALLRRLNTQLGEKGELTLAINQFNDLMRNAKHWTAKDGPLKEELAKIQAQMSKVSGKLTGSLDNADKLMQEFRGQALDDNRMKKLLVQLEYTIRHDVRVALAQITESMRVFKQTMVQMQSNPDSFFLGKRSKTRR